MMPPHSTVGTRRRPKKPPASSGAASTGSRQSSASAISLRVPARRTGISIRPMEITASSATRSTRQRSDAG